MPLRSATDRTAFFRGQQHRNIVGPDREQFGLEFLLDQRHRPPHRLGAVQRIGADAGNCHRIGHRKQVAGVAGQGEGNVGHALQQDRILLGRRGIQRASRILLDGQLAAGDLGQFLRERREDSPVHRMLRPHEIGQAEFRGVCRRTGSGRQRDEDCSCSRLSNVRSCHFPILPFDPLVEPESAIRADFRQCTVVRRATEDGVPVQSTAPCAVCRRSLPADTRLRASAGWDRLSGKFEFKTGGGTGIQPVHRRGVGVSAAEAPLGGLIVTVSWTVPAASFTPIATIIPAGIPIGV